MSDGVKEGGRKEGREGGREGGRTYHGDSEGGHGCQVGGDGFRLPVGLGLEKRI